MTDIFREALGHFLDVHDFENVSFLPTSGGVNNVVFYVKIDSEINYVLRIYNNGNDDSKVVFEHSILAQLSLHSFSFKLPQTIPSLHDGKAFVRLSSGASACLFKLIPGVLPKLTNVEAIGRVSGELNRAMYKIDRHQLPLVSPNPPYYDLYKVHHAITRDLFFSKINSEDLDVWRSEADFIIQEITEIEGKIGTYLANPSILPINLIHGDLHYDNILCDEGGVTGE